MHALRIHPHFNFSNFYLIQQKVVLLKLLYFSNCTTRNCGTIKIIWIGTVQYQWTFVWASDSNLTFPNASAYFPFAMQTALLTPQLNFLLALDNN